MPHDAELLAARVGTHVRVHLNLTRGSFVVSDPKTKRLVGYADSVVLDGVTFRVSEAVRQSCITKKGRWVHAFAFGTLVALDSEPDVSGMRRVSYNPFTGPSFTCEGEPVDALDRVTFVSKAGWTA